MRPIAVQESSATTGYLILSALAVMVFALAFQDANLIIFAIPILLVFVLGASIDKGSVDKDLEAVGWSGKNTGISIPFGIMGGLAGIFIGGIVMQFTPENVASIVPDMSSMGQLATASVVPPALAVSANIISQWLIVSPSEEALSKVLGPFAGMAIFKNVFVAYIFGSLIWIGMHVPTFIMQAVPAGMYYVLGILAIITVILYFITRNLLSAIIAHGTFNTGVIVLSAGLDMTGYYVIFGIIAVLSIAWVAGGKK